MFNFLLISACLLGEIALEPIPDVLGDAKITNGTSQLVTVIAVSKYAIFPA